MNTQKIERRIFVILLCFYPDFIGNYLLYLFGRPWLLQTFIESHESKYESKALSCFSILYMYFDAETIIDSEIR